MLNANQKGAGLSRGTRVAILLAVAAAGFGVVSLLLPVFMVTDHAKDVQCRSHLKQLGYACRLYANDNAGAFPPDLGALFPDYVTKPDVFVCGRLQDRTRLLPYEGPPTRPVPEASIAFCYVAGLKADDAEETILAFGEEWNHPGRGAYCLSVGGLVRLVVNLERLHAQLAKQAAEFKTQGREVKLIRPSWSRWPDRPEYPPVPWDRRKAVSALVIGGAALVVLGVGIFLFRSRKGRRA